MIPSPTTIWTRKANGWCIRFCVAYYGHMWFGRLMRDNDGTDFQKAFQACLVKLQEEEQVYWHRFTDTKAARNFVKSQPGDFMVIGRGVPHLFELKSTDVGTTLSKFLSSKEGKHEVAEARKWERAGGKAWFVREDTRKGEVEFYQAKLWVDGNKEPVGVCKTEKLFDAIKLFIGMRTG